MTVYSVGIVGCGVIGSHHARVLARHPRFAVATLIDPTPAARAVRDELGDATISVFASLDEALASDTSFDVVVICTPSGTHVEFARAALAAGRHVIVEKPLDVSVERGAELWELARAARLRGQLTSVISQHRFDPASVAVQNAIQRGQFGVVGSAVASVAWWRSQDYYDSGDWRGTWALDGGGAAMNQGVHTVDLLRWFLGRPVEVFCSAALLAHERVEVEDTDAAVVRFESGALATVLTTTAAYPGLSARIQVHGSRGSAVIDDDRLAFFHAAQPKDEADGHGTPSAAPTNDAASVVGFDHTAEAPRRDDDFAVGHSRQYDDIADALDTGREPAVTVEEALLSLALVEAMYRSARSGAPVFIAELLGDAARE